MAEQDVASDDIAPCFCKYRDDLHDARFHKSCCRPAPGYCAWKGYVSIPQAKVSLGSHVGSRQ